jgi:DNA-binding transcriptional MerR regulator
MPEPDAERGSLRIGALSRRVGVTPPVLRAWESRYGLLEPDRSDGGYRLYSAADEQAVRAMKRHMARGLSTAQAAEAALAERSGKTATQIAGPGGAEGVAADSLTRSLLAYDEGEAQAILDRAFALQPLEEVLTGLISETLRRIGDGWERGEITVAQEHFASNIVRARLVALARGWDVGRGSPVVLACAPAEMHDIGLVCFGLALWRRGWRIVFLGQTTPVADMAEAVAGVDAAVLVVHAHTEEFLSDCEEDLRAIGGDFRLAFSGAGVTGAAADRLGGERLEGGPVDAALAADRSWQALR